VHPSQGVADMQQSAVSGDTMSFQVNVLKNLLRQHAKCIASATESTIDGPPIDAALPLVHWFNRDATLSCATITPLV
jgi:hypothetical protein